MSSSFELTATKRDDLGKGASRRLRRVENGVPAIVYGGDEAATAITIEHNHFSQALNNEAFFSHILTLKIDGKEQKAVLKALQRHPFKPKIVHADFLRVNANAAITMHVPIHFINEDIAPGVKQGGGLVSHIVNEVEVKCLPADLPEFIEVDCANLELDSSLHLSDIKLPKGVEIIELSHGEGHDSAIVSIHTKRVVEETEEAPVAPDAAGDAKAEDSSDNNSNKKEN